MWQGEDATEEQQRLRSCHQEAHAGHKRDQLPRLLPPPAKIAVSSVLQHV